MTYRDLLREVAEQAAPYGQGLQPPCDEAGLAELRRRLRDQLRTELGAEHAELLRLTDGLNWNGLFLHPSATAPIVCSSYPDRTLHGIVDWNLDIREIGGLDDLLFLGDDCLDLYARRGATDEYLIMDRTCLDVVETPPSFDALLSTALRRCLS